MDHSYFEVDQIMTTNLKVDTVLSTSGATAISLNDGNVAVSFPAANLTVAAADMLTLQTDLPGVRFACNGAAYAISADGGDCLHYTDAAAHELQSGDPANARLRIAADADGVTLSAATIALSAASVAVTGDLLVTNKLAANASGVYIGDGAAPVTLRGVTTVAGPCSINGLFSVGGLFTADPATHAVGINGAPVPGTALALHGNATLAGSVTIADLTVSGSASIYSFNTASLTANAVTSNALQTATASVENLHANALVANSIATAGITSGTANFASVSVTGNAYAYLLNANRALLGNLTANVAQLANLTATTASVNSLFAASCVLGDGIVDPSKALNVTGNAAISATCNVGQDLNVIAGKVTIGVLSEAGKNLKVYGASHITGDLAVDGNLVATAIGAPGSDLTLTANTLNFNTNTIVFRGNSYVIASNTLTYTDKIIQLGNVTYTNAQRDGSGITLLGVPDHKPANVTGAMGIHWLAAGGLFDAAGNVVTANVRSRWEVAGGNLTLKSTDELNSYMFSVDGGVLNLFKMNLAANGSPTASQLVASFGRNATI